MTEALSNSGDVRPIPDPTHRTIETLYREVAGLQETFDAKMLSRGDLIAEKFSSVHREFELVEKQRVEQKKDTKDAVDAALTAQKEAVKEQTIASERAIAKSETATNKQMDQMTATFSASIGGVTDLLNDTKDRAGKMETRISNIETAKQSAADTTVERRAVSSQTIAIAAVVVVLFSGVFSALVSTLIKVFGG